MEIGAANSFTYRDDDASDDPDDGTDHDGLLATKAVRDESGDERRQPGATGHGSSDAALNVGPWTDAFLRALVEVAEVGWGGNDGGHGLGRLVWGREGVLHEGRGTDMSKPVLGISLDMFLVEEMC